MQSGILRSSPNILRGDEVKLKSEEIRLFSSEEARVSIEHLAERGTSLIRLTYDLEPNQYAGCIVPAAEGDGGSLPENFAISFEIRGTTNRGRLECKIVTDGGSGVWWYVDEKFSLKDGWQSLHLRKRDFQYAWGASREDLSSFTQIELVFTAEGASSGELEFQKLSSASLPSSAELFKQVEPSSTGGCLRADSLFLDNETSGWEFESEQVHSLTLEFPSDIELGGLILCWENTAPESWVLEIKDTRGEWMLRERVAGFFGDEAFHHLPNTDTSGIRITFPRDANPQRRKLRSLIFQNTKQGASLDALFSSKAERGFRGCFPRYYLNEQSHWTIVASEGSSEKALVNEDALFELGYGRPSLEAFVLEQGSVRSWAQACATQTLLENNLPIPQIEQGYGDISLQSTYWMEGERGSERVYVRYKLGNLGNGSKEGTLAIAIRPFRVNPPWQFLNAEGGHVPLYSIECREGGAEVVLNGDTLLRSEDKPSEYFVCDYWNGDCVERLLTREQGFTRGSVSNALHGAASAALLYEYSLGMGEEFLITLEVLAEDKTEECRTTRGSLEQEVMRWEERLSGFTLKLPHHPELFETLRAQLAYILVNKDGAALQPGTRSYRRTWIRDSTMSCSALLQFGFFKEVRDLIEWYRPHVCEDGFVPCVLDSQRVDMTPEHDSHGQFLFLVAEYTRYSGDWGYFEKVFPVLVRVAEKIRTLRTEQTVRASEQHYKGLLPKSISHEGYASSPAFSYWDNVWALVGLQAFARCLQLGEIHKNKAAELFAEIEDFGNALRESIALAMEVHGIDFIPGSADLGDLDATSTTIGVDPSDFYIENFPQALAVTFERYWEMFAERKEEFSGNERFTPYEIRALSTFHRLGQIGHMREALDFFMSHRRPAGWKHWAEVVWADYREPAFLGDAPHGWVASDYIRSLRSFIYYEQDTCSVIGSGLEFEDWKAGVEVDIPLPENSRLQVFSEAKGSKVTVEIKSSYGSRFQFKLPRACSLDGERRAEHALLEIELPFVGVLERIED